jgi:hypothetical protein
MSNVPGATAAFVGERVKRVEPTQYIRGIKNYLATKIDDDQVVSLQSEDVALALELDPSVLQGRQGPIGREKLTRQLNKIHVAISFAMFIVIAVWKFASNGYFLENNRLVYVNVSVGGLMACIYLLSGTSFLYRCFLAYRKVKAMDRRINSRRKLVLIMAGVDLFAGLSSISAFLAGNGVSLYEDCGYFLGAVRVLTSVRTLALGIILSNQMCLSMVAMPVQMLFTIIDKLHLGRVVRVLDRSDKLREVVHGVDLPSWVYVFVFSVYFIPWLVLTLLFALAITGPLGGAWCTSIYDTACYPGAIEGLSCHQWEYPCRDITSAARGIGIAKSVYGLVVMVIYLSTVGLANLFLKSLPYGLYRTSHVELGFQISTRSHATLLLLLSVIVLWIADSETCDSQVLLMLGFLPNEMIACYLVWTTLIVRTPYFLSKDEFDALGWNKTFVWEQKNVKEHEAYKPLLSKKSTLCFERAIQAFFFSWVSYDMEEKPQSLFTIDTAMRLHGLDRYKLIWKRKLDAKAVLSWNTATKTIVVAVRGTASTKNACTDLKVFRSAHPPPRGKYWLASQPLIHSGFAEFWYDSGLQADILDAIDYVIDGDSSKGRWEVWCYGHSLGGATAKLAALDIHRHLEGSRMMDTSSFSVSCMTYGCPYVGNQSFVNDFESTIKRSWDLFHPNDAVSVTGKWIMMYARCSQVCLISRFGDLVVNPSALERSSLHLFHFKSVEEHLLATYARSLCAIIQKWTLMEEASTEKAHDTWANLLAENHAMQDVLDILESVAVIDEEERGRPRSAGAEAAESLLRKWNQLDLEFLKVLRRKETA